MDDFGSALTGQTVEPAQAQSQWDSWLERPGNRTAMLQMGLQLMQPVAIGQTPLGHIGEAIGAGGEAVARNESSDLKERVADAKMNAADERLRISQQQADANTSRANTAAIRGTQKKVGGLTDLFKARAAREDARGFEKQLDKDAADIVKQANDPLMDPNADVVKKYKGKSKIDVREALRAERPKPKFGDVPNNDASDDEEADANDTQQAPTTPGAKLAPDGNYYMPDPARPGKFLKVNQ